MQKKETIQSVLNTYKNCITYCDSGNVKYVDFYDNGDVISEDEENFETEYIKPKHFYFKRKNKFDDKQYIIKANEEKVLVKWFMIEGNEGSGEVESLSSAIISEPNGIAQIIAALLFPNDKQYKQKLLGSSTIEFFDDCIINGIDCFCFKTKYLGDLMTFWVDKSNLTIQKIYSKIPFENSHDNYLMESLESEMTNDEFSEIASVLNSSGYTEKTILFNKVIIKGE